MHTNVRFFVHKVLITTSHYSQRTKQFPIWRRIKEMLHSEINNKPSFCIFPLTYFAFTSWKTVLAEALPAYYFLTAMWILQSCSCFVVLFNRVYFFTLFIHFFPKVPKFRSIKLSMMLYSQGHTVQMRWPKHGYLGQWVNEMKLLSSFNWLIN